MATLSVGLPRPASRRRRPHLALPTFLEGIRARVYLTLALIIVLTLVIAGVVLFFLLGGYQDRLAASTLRQIGGPVYESVATLANANFQAFEVSRQLQGTVGGESDVLILFVEADGLVLSEASSDPRFRGELLDIELADAGIGSAGFIDGTLVADDGTRLNYAATGLEPVAAERFNASHIVLALPNENRQAVLGDLTPRLIVAGGFALLAAIILALLLSRSMYRPLEATTAAARPSGGSPCPPSPSPAASTAARRVRLRLAPVSPSGTGKTLIASSAEALRSTHTAATAIASMNSRPLTAPGAAFDSSDMLLAS